MQRDEMDVWFDFTNDSISQSGLGYWDGFWKGPFGEELKHGIRGSNPNTDSETLRKYHRLLWNRELPNGQLMELEWGGSDNRLFLWNGMKFASEYLTTAFIGRWSDSPFQGVLDAVVDSTPDYRSYVEGYLHDFNTIGGFVILPVQLIGLRRVFTMKSRKPLHGRWDLMLECIRRHYAGEDNLLSDACRRDIEFLNLFVDFEGYVQFFYLQDCLDSATGKVKFWIGDGDLRNDTLPRDVEEYRKWIEAQREFVKARNIRIEKALET